MMQKSCSVSATARPKWLSVRTRIGDAVPWNALAARDFSPAFAATNTGRDSNSWRRVITDITTSDARLFYCLSYNGLYL